MRLTPSGKTARSLKHGPNQRHSGPHTIRPVTTSHSISGTLSLRGSRFARLWDAARLRWRDAYLLSGVREPCQCLLSGGKAENIYSHRAFPVWTLSGHRAFSRTVAVRRPYSEAKGLGLTQSSYPRTKSPDLLK